MGGGSFVRNEALRGDGRLACRRGGCTFATGTQLGDAEQFLQAHRGQVTFLTIDIGANNLDGCFSLSGIDANCVTTGENQVATDLP